MEGKQQAPVAVVTGASGGIGRATAALLAQKGYKVYGLSRRPGPAQILHISTDVREPAAVAAAFRQILEEAGRIDLLILNAGFGISGPLEFTGAEAAQRQFQVNFFGALSCAQAALPQMRAQGGGCILFVSSVAAVLPIPFQGLYSASKAALNALAGALANEVRPFSIRVAALMPGDIHTGFTAAREKEKEGSGVYRALEGSLARMERDEAGGMDPAAVAAALYRLARKRRLRPLYTLGLQYRFFTLLQRLLPGRLVSWLLYRLYGLPPRA